MDEALRVREFWFGGQLAGPLSGSAEEAAMLEQRAAAWFDPGSPERDERDAIIRGQFADLLERAASGRLQSWADSPRRRLSLVILLDQFPRQMYRGSARAFAYDERALGLVLSGIQSAADGALNLVERMFFYLPLQHAESTDVQEESLAAYRRLYAEAPESMRATFAQSLESAERHRTAIQRFGRFPQRNAALGRESTAQEREYLQQDAPTFGQ